MYLLFFILEVVFNNAWLVEFGIAVFNKSTIPSPFIEELSSGAGSTFAILICAAFSICLTSAVFPGDTSYVDTGCWAFLASSATFIFCALAYSILSNAFFLRAASFEVRVPGILSKVKSGEKLFSVGNCFRSFLFNMVSFPLSSAPWDFDEAEVLTFPSVDSLILFLWLYILS